MYPLTLCLIVALISLAVVCGLISVATAYGMVIVAIGGMTVVSAGRMNRRYR